MITHQERRADLQLKLTRRCFVCLRHSPEAETHVLLYDSEIKGWLCVGPCQKGAQAVRCKPVPGRPGRGRTRPLPEWRALLVAMRPKPEAQA